MRATLAILLLSGLSLTACDQTQFLHEAGSGVDEGNFGAPTMTNTLAMTGHSATTTMGNRFASEVTTTVNFAFNSAVLSAQAKTTLNRQAGWIKQFPELRFKVYGHTDKVGSDAYNKALGLRRANAVVAYFAGQGIATSRLEALVSYGETQPIINTPGPELRNRRTVTEVAGWVGGNGGEGELNGKYAAVIFREYVDSAIPKAGGATATTGFVSAPGAPGG